MAIQHRDPLSDLLRIQQRVNRLFEEAVARSGEGRAAETVGHSGWKPAVDVFERNGGYVLRADLPGMSADDVEIEVEDDTLVLRGDRRSDESVAPEAYLRVERPQGRFALQIALPPSIDREGIEARHRDGVLEVTLPKQRDRESTRLKVDVR